MISFWCFNVLDLFLGTSIAGFAPLPGQGCWKTSGGIWSIRFTTRRETQPGKVESEVNRKGRSVISAYGHLATSMVRRPSVSSVFVNQKIISNCLQFLSLPPSCHLLIGSKKAISPSPCARAKCWFQLLGPEALQNANWPVNPSWNGGSRSPVSWMISSKMQSKDGCNQCPRRTSPGPSSWDILDATWMLY